ncbi:type II TA system antitoxin MqsA family protein [Bacillus kwashiorkori]|uniref:type II TA system antitoxin MqsA family protein n=1 Tax=Bacillus kwashiorkori TaxID=1522318 RepID=UPI0007806E13|nr:type II TA system antitoxin MqsA family protein [Bacillus kwashiorkori]
MAFEHFCPECLETRGFESIFIEEDYPVKNEVITIDSHYYKCNECGELILDPENEDENYVNAYNEYRKRKNLLFPEEIIEIREKYDISQRQMAKILGWSHATLSRYETGALQSQSHNNELVLLQDPVNMLKIIERNKDNLTKQGYDRIKSKVKTMIVDHSSKSLYTMVESSFITEPSEYNGFTTFNLEKLINVVKYFLYRDSQVYKVKLMKYLWFTDFFHFKNWTVSLTGLKYAKLPMGPVPDNYDMLISLILNEDKLINREYIDFGNGQGELFTVIEDFDSSLFTEEEIKTLEIISKLLQPHNSRSVSELSHKELAWLETRDRELITYKYAEQLSLS